MPEEIIEGQDPNEKTPPAGEVGDQESETEQQAIDAEKLMAELKKTRREAAKYRTQLRKLEEAEAERQREEMSELERLKSDLEAEKSAREQALATARAQAIRSAVVSAASKAGFADPADAVNFIDADALTIGDDGGVEGVDEAIKALAEQKPYLIKSNPAVQPGATNPAGASLGVSEKELRAEMYGGGNSAVWDGGVKVFKEK